MIETMRELALFHLGHSLGLPRVDISQLRRERGTDLLSFLVEAGEKIERVYLIGPLAGRPGEVTLWAEELDDAKRRRLPFNKPTGSNSPPLGPVIKRSYKNGQTPPYGPSAGIQDAAGSAFLRIAKDAEIWSGYFGEAHQAWFGSKLLHYQGRAYHLGESSVDRHALAAALRLIPEKQTAYVAYCDSEGHWPGDRKEYLNYLGQILVEAKYATRSAPPYQPATCPLCGTAGTVVYANGLKGAGINLSNVDREGAFPGLDATRAWRGYGLCLDCADLLYIFKNHVVQDFLAPIAGKRALLLPALLGNDEGRRLFMKDFAAYRAGLEHDSSIKFLEEDLMEFYQGRDDAQLVLHVIWATLGQLLDDVRGVVNDILPSRLRALERLNGAVNDWNHALAPKVDLEEAKFRLSLNFLDPLFHRPGGRRSKTANASPQLFNIKRDLAAALYHGSPLGDGAATLWTEILVTARAYLDEARATGYTAGLLEEGFSTKKGKQTRYWTLAGWVRHLARFFYYLDQAGVMPMCERSNLPVPEIEALKPYFQPGGGIDTDEKTFTFLLGILYGKVLAVQGAKRLNVGANALSWLRSLNLTGRDLPELYCKVREKLLVYGTEGNAEVREIVNALGRVGAVLGDRIELDNTATCYFLLLGQSISREVLPSSSEH